MGGAQVIIGLRIIVNILIRACMFTFFEVQRKILNYCEPKLAKIPPKTNLKIILNLVTAHNAF